MSLRGRRWVVSAVTAALLLVRASAADPQPNTVARPLVVLDAGHSSESPGARSARGVAEHDFNLAVAQGSRARLVANARVEVELIDGGARTIPPRQRAELAASRHASVLVSIHHDAAHLEDRIPSGDGVNSYSVVARGFSLHVRPDRPPSVALARLVAARMRSLGFTPSAYHASRHPPIDLALGIYARDDLAILNASSVSALILECGFISDRDEERALADAATQARIAEAVAGAIEAFLQLERPGSGRGDDRGVTR